MKVMFIQSADAFKYAEMLQVTSRTVIEYCRAHDFGYESFTGVKRGFYSWQATYNRIFQLKELMDRGFDGWVVHLDADAYIVDLDFDLAGYLSEKNGYGAILTPSMATDNHWDVNVGVALINLAHPVGRRLVTRWHARMAEKLPDERLRQAEAWLDDDSDQDLLQQMLMHEPEFAPAVYIQSTDLINSSYARFIRQHLRGYSTTFDERMAAIKQDVEAVVGKADVDLRQDAASFQAGIEEGIHQAKQGIAIAMYKGLLGREPEESGRLGTLEHLEAFDVEEGVRTLILNILASEEYRSRSKSL